MFREMKKKNPHTININYTLEKEISMKKMEFLFKRVLFIYLFFFTRFTYFNTVAQTFYILINSQEVSRKSRVSCTSILNLFFFFSSMYRAVTVFAFYFTWSIFPRFFFHGVHLLHEERAKCIYLNLLFLFNVF